MKYSYWTRRRARARLLTAYRAGLAAVDGERCVRRTLEGRPITGPVRAVAVGKAAAAMLTGAFSVLGDGLEQALLITKAGYGPPRPLPRTEQVEAGHPVPDALTLIAGERLLGFIQAAPASTNWLFLISGGASSLVEVLPDGLDLDTLRRVNDWLLASGLPIEAMNAVRGRLSRIKGGRLREMLGRSPVRVLLLSDVAGDDPRIIGSGLLHCDDRVHRLPSDCPAWLLDWLSKVSPAPESSRLPAPDTEIVARLDDALDAAAATAGEFGLSVWRHQPRLTGDAATTGRDLAKHLLNAEPGFHLWGGETTVRLPARPGVGGRCQQLALAAAQALAGRGNSMLLAAATDGSDGPTTTAGAVVDGGTLERGQAEGQDPCQALALADAGTFLAAAGDLIETGPTGSNVNDLVIALKLPVETDLTAEEFRDDD